jgi:hypothetical protein
MKTVEERLAALEAAVFGLFGKEEDKGLVDEVKKIKEQLQEYKDDIVDDDDDDDDDSK